MEEEIDRETVCVCVGIECTLCECVCVCVCVNACLVHQKYVIYYGYIFMNGGQRKGREGANGVADRTIEV